MNFGSLKEMIKSNNKQIPTHRTFKETSTLKKLLNFDAFTLNASQRMACIVTTGAIGGISFFYSITKLFTVLFSPSSFLVPYLLSNCMIFSMIGFIKGFDHFLKSLLQHQRRRYSMIFAISTLATIFNVWLFRSYVLSVLSVIFQTVGFGCFCFSFVPFGCQTLNGLFMSTFGI